MPISNSTPSIAKMDQDEMINLFQFYVWGLVGSPICVVGVLGNIMAICVLMHHNMRHSPSSIYLIALATSDIVILIGFFFSFALPLIGFEIKSDSVTAYFIYPLSLTFQTFTVYTIVGFTVERFLAIKYPFKHMCNSPRRTLRVVVFIFALSCLYNLPRLFENIPIAAGNNTSLNRTTATVLKDHYLYNKIYLTFLYPPVMFILPFVTLSVLNISILSAIKTSWKHKPATSHHTAGSSSKSAANTNTALLLSNSSNAKINLQSSRERNISILIVSIVFIFLICQILPMIDHIIISYFGIPHSKGYYMFFTISSVFVAINSAVNFIVYSLIGQKFRHTMFLIFCRKMATSIQISRMDTNMEPCSRVIQRENIDIYNDSN